MIPRGVTIRLPGQAIPSHAGPRNVLEAAAMLESRDAARRMIEAALGLSNNSQLAQVHLSWSERWAKLSPPSRLMEIGEWIKAECYEVMDLVEVTSLVTIGD